MVVSKIGCSLDLPASTIAANSSISCETFSLILSRKIIASLTTIPASAMKPIANGILYGFPVTARPILTPRRARIIVKSMIAGLVNELNIKSKITNINASEMINQRSVAEMSSAFSCHSPTGSAVTPWGN